MIQFIYTHRIINKDDVKLDKDDAKLDKEDEWSNTSLIDKMISILVLCDRFQFANGIHACEMELISLLSLSSCSTSGLEAIWNCKCQQCKQKIGLCCTVSDWPLSNHLLSLLCKTLYQKVQEFLVSSWQVCFFFCVCFG